MSEEGVMPVPETAGAILRRAREGTGLHIAALAVSLKVPVRKLEALEADRLDQLGDAVFVRALASSVCRSLKMDPAPVLQLLPQNPAPRLDAHRGGINAPFRAPGDGPGPSLWEQLSRPAVLSVLAFLLGALVLIFFPDVQREASPSPTAVAPASATDSGKPAVAAESAGSTAPSAAAASSVGRPADEASTSVVVSAVLSTPSVASPTLVVSPAAAVPAALSGAEAVTGIVVFRTKSSSWIEVTDSSGQVTLRRMLGAGEVAGASGMLPLSVVVGRADATTVQVRGKPLDILVHARENVARFEVR
jgi:cytoskeleton protein RodZ